MHGAGVLEERLTVPLPWAEGSPKMVGRKKETAAHTGIKPLLVPASCMSFSPRVTAGCLSWEIVSWPYS